jgi:hypothetical protein
MSFRSYATENLRFTSPASFKSFSRQPLDLSDPLSVVLAFCQLLLAMRSRSTATTHQVHELTGHGVRVCACEEDWQSNFSFGLNRFSVKLTVSRAHLGRHVCSRVQRQRANTPVVHVVSRSGSGLQWGVHGSGADCVHSDVLWSELHSQ